MKGGLLSALLVGQREIIAEGAVDEFGAGVGIEQHDADVDLVERGRQPVGGGVMLAAPSAKASTISCRSRPVMTAVPPAVTASSASRARSAAS